MVGRQVNGGQCKPSYIGGNQHPVAAAYEILSFFKNRRGMKAMRRRDFLHFRRKIKIEIVRIEGNHTARLYMAEVYAECFAGDEMGGNGGAGKKHPLPAHQIVAGVRAPS